MSKRFRRWLLAAVAVLCAGGMGIPARAQFIGFTSPQTVTATFTGQACTGSVALNLPNLGQSFHYVNYVVTGSPVQTAVTIQGSYDGLTFFIISDQATDLLNTGSQVVGYGYFPVFRVVVGCTGGTAPTATVNYSGTSVSSSLQFTDLDRTIFRKPVFTGASQGAVNNSNTIRPPYGNSAGVMACQALTAGFPANSTVTIVNLADNNISAFTLSGPYTLQSSTSPQFFPIAALPTSAIQLQYANGGASANTFNCEILFSKPGAAGIDPCGASTVKTSASVAIAAATTTQIIAPGTTTTVYLCGWNFTVNGTAPTYQFITGTGATCGTGTVTETGVFAPTVGSLATYAPAMTAFSGAAGAGVCIVTGGTAPSVQGIVTFVQQ